MNVLPHKTKLTWKGWRWIAMGIAAFSLPSAFFSDIPSIVTMVCSFCLGVYWGVDTTKKHNDWHGYRIVSNEDDDTLIHLASFDMDQAEDMLEDTEEGAIMYRLMAKGQAASRAELVARRAEREDQ